MEDQVGFTFEFHAELPYLSNASTTQLRDEAKRRLEKLAEGHDDLIGAAVTLERVAHGETPHVYEATVVAYIRPENIVGKEKADTTEAALKAALHEVERQVREKRTRLRERWKQP